MATVEQTGDTPSQVADLGGGIPQKKSKGYWADAWSRLIRNRLAVIGLTIIAINFVIAIFAPVFAPFDPTQQDRVAADAAPAWLMEVFPTLSPRDESWRIRDGEVLVETGDQVSEGQLLVDNITGGDQISANMAGTVFVNSSRVELTPLDVSRIEYPADAELRVVDDLQVEEGDIIYGSVEAPQRGTAYVTDEAVYIRPFNTGYTPLRNEFPLGADSLGRDLWSRIVYGARVSLLAALIGPAVSLLIGVPYGLIAGYIGGRVDNLMMRFVDLMYGFPTLLLIILLMAFFRSSGSATTDTDSFMYQMGELDRSTGGMFFIFLGLGLTVWMNLARITRGQVLAIREQEYVTAAKSIGSTTPTIVTRHVLPNALGPIIITETLMIPTYIRFEAFLSFIGLGVNPPTPSWGNMISDGAKNLRSFPHEAIFPAIALFIIMFAFNFLGDGLRDALDPRMRGTD